jgi:hypothetical protein
MDTLAEISALLHIHEKAHAHGTALTNIRDAAWRRLQQLNAEHQQATNENGTDEPAEAPCYEPGGAPGEAPDEGYSHAT